MTSKEFTVKIQSNSIPVITKSCELSDRELRKIIFLFRVILDNRRRIK